MLCYGLAVLFLAAPDCHSPCKSYTTQRFSTGHCKKKKEKKKINKYINKYIHIDIGSQCYNQNLLISYNSKAESRTSQTPLSGSWALCNWLRQRSLSIPSILVSVEEESMFLTLLCSHSTAMARCCDLLPCLGSKPTHSAISSMKS